MDGRLFIQRRTIALGNRSCLPKVDADDAPRVASANGPGENLFPNPSDGLFRTAACALPVLGSGGLEPVGASFLTLA